MVKYILGDGNIDYYFTDDHKGLIGYHYWKGQTKYFSVPVFLWLVDNHFFSNVELIYYDDWGQAHIAGKINGSKVFNIRISEEDYKKIQNGTADENVKEIIRRCKDGKAQLHFEDVMKEASLDGELPDDFEELEKYKEFLQQQIYTSTANLGANFRLRISPAPTMFMGYGVGSLANEVSATNAYIGTALEIAAMAICGASFLVAVDNIFTHFFSYSPKQYNSLNEDDHATIDKCEREIKRVEEKLEIFYKNHDTIVNRFKENLSIFVNKAASIIPNIPEDQKDDYFEQLRLITENFNSEISDTSTYSELKDSFEIAIFDITSLYIKYAAPLEDYKFNADKVLFDKNGTYELARH